MQRITSSLFCILFLLFLLSNSHENTSVLTVQSNGAAHQLPFSIELRSAACSNALHSPASWATKNKRWLKQCQSPPPAADTGALQHFDNYSSMKPLELAMQFLNQYFHFLIPSEISCEWPTSSDIQYPCGFSEMIIWHALHGPRRKILVCDKHQGGTDQKTCLWVLL